MAKVLVRNGKFATYGDKVVEVEATSAEVFYIDPVTYDGSIAQTVEIADGTEVSY